MEKTKDLFENKLINKKWINKQIVEIVNLN
jgi:hypothetical protein